jgi:hypothetical protein
MRYTAVLVTASVLVAATHANADEPTIPPGWLGVTVDGPVKGRDAGEWNRMRRAGVQTVRSAFSWRAVQPLPPVEAAPNATLHFATTDALVLAGARRGITTLPVVQWPPEWAAVHPALLNSAPAAPGDVERIFRALVERYGPRGSLWAERPEVPRRPIVAWQVFNEPNLGMFWSVQPFAEPYTETLQAAARGIRAVDPGARVVVAGLTADSWVALDQLYAAGARGAFDAVAIHPYTARPADVIRVVRYVRGVMRRNGDGKLPVWITEFSWPAAAGRFPDNPPWADNTDAEQARLLARTMRRFTTARRTLRIERVLWYTWLSAANGTSVFEYSGLRRVAHGKRRSVPALRVFRRWARRLEGCARGADGRFCG